MLILDTHIWIYLMNGDQKIKKSGFLKLIEKAAPENAIKIPTICSWEISMLAAKKRILISGDALSWIKKSLTLPGISLCSLSPEIAYESSNLPGNFHGDPADRIIVASARVLNGTLLTFDQKILCYAKEGHLKCAPCRL